MQRRTIGTRRAVVLALMVAGALVISVITDSLPADGGQPPAPGIRVAQRFRPRGGLRPAPDTGDDELGLDGVFLPPDRTAKRRLELAQEMLGRAAFRRRRAAVGRAVGKRRGFLLQAGSRRARLSQPESRSRPADRRAAGRRPRVVRTAVRGPRAQLLTEAAAPGNLADLAEVSRQFFYTDAGQEATFLLARHHLDQNRPLAAALCLERLRAVPAAARGSSRRCRLRWPLAGCGRASRDRSRETLRATEAFERGGRSDDRRQAGRVVRKRRAGGRLARGQVGAAAPGAQHERRRVDDVSRRRKPQRRQRRRPAAVERPLAAARGRRRRGGKIRRQGASRLPEPGYRRPAQHAPAGRGRRGGDAHRLCASRRSISTTASWSGNTRRSTMRFEQFLKVGSLQQHSARLAATDVRARPAGVGGRDLRHAVQRRQPSLLHRGARPGRRDDQYPLYRGCPTAAARNRRTRGAPTGWPLASCARRAS